MLIKMKTSSILSQYLAKEKVLLIDTVALLGHKFQYENLKIKIKAVIPI